MSIQSPQSNIGKVERRYFDCLISSFDIWGSYIASCVIRRFVATETESPRGLMLCNKSRQRFLSARCLAMGVEETSWSSVKIIRWNQYSERKEQTSKTWDALKLLSDTITLLKPSDLNIKLLNSNTNENNKKNSHFASLYYTKFVFCIIV